MNNTDTMTDLQETITALELENYDLMEKSSILTLNVSDLEEQLAEALGE